MVFRDKGTILLNILKMIHVKYHRTDDSADLNVPREKSNHTLTKKKKKMFEKHTTY